ncbi:MAG: hypothetical protein H6567_03465 [Lewinellaceae bacterium]|nr:hypothetical protein [Lewinellaceae bacterium]
MTKFILFSIILLLKISPLLSQDKKTNVEIFTKSDINYIYNRLLNEILTNDQSVMVDYNEYFKYYKKKDIVIEINTLKNNVIFSFYKETKDLTQFQILKKYSRIEKLKFITPFQYIKKRHRNFNEYFNQGIIHIDFTDIIISKNGEFYLGVEKVEMVPGVFSKDVNLAWNYVLKGIICPSGQIILQDILMQHDAGIELSNIKCN